MYVENILSIISMLSIFLVVVFIVAYIILMNYASSIGREELEKFSLLLDSALKYPVSPESLNNLILVWKRTRLTSSNLEFYIKEKYIDRSFRVCEMNLTNLNTWDLLEIVVKKVSSFRAIPFYKDATKKMSLRLEEHLLESFYVALENEELWEKMKSFLDSLVGCGIMTSRPIKFFYDITLKNIEDNSNQTKARQLALETGRLYFGWGRLGIVSAKNEIAIQNDINARIVK